MLATRADIEAIYGQRHLETLVPSDVDMDVAVSAALAQAQALIESYVRRRYAVPLQARPMVLVSAAIDIACWKLAPAADRVSEEIAKRAKMQLEWLKDVAAGRADIDELEPAASASQGDGQSAASESGAAFSSNARRWPGGGRIL